ncbi:MAG: hypothetical protein AAF682_28535 [Planctomycetota bacterium]
MTPREPDSDPAGPAGAAPDEGWRELPEGEQHSWGNVSDRHWSRAREGSNREAIDHMRERSKAPGVESGGGARNHYCMSCNGVIPIVGEAGVVEAPEHCPHCGAALDDRVRAMFNWVEIDEPPQSDAGALLRVALGGLAAIVVIAALAWRILQGW